MIDFEQWEGFEGRIPLNVKALFPAHKRENHFWFSFGAQKRT